MKPTYPACPQCAEKFGPIYTPSVEDMRLAYADSRTLTGVPYRQAVDEFDRGIAAIRELSLNA